MDVSPTKASEIEAGDWIVDEREYCGRVSPAATLVNQTSIYKTRGAPHHAGRFFTMNCYLA